MSHIAIISSSGAPFDGQEIDKRAAKFVQELLWCIEAMKRMTE